MSNSSNIAATADATKVRFSLFEELGLKNRFVIGLPQCGATAPGPRLIDCVRYVNVNVIVFIVMCTLPENTVSSG